MSQDRSTKRVSKSLRVNDHLLRSVAKGGYADGLCHKLGVSWAWSGSDIEINDAISAYKQDHKNGRPKSI